MRAIDIRAFMDGQAKADGSNLPQDWWLAEIAAQLAEHNERETARGRDYVRLLNNYLTREAMDWPNIETSKRLALEQVAKIIGWASYPK